ncbi:MAG: hypothetical protein KAT85_03550, partial [candidate division Zixibacteria bacterium]|nr:hypothetical protein [candidate division Zixibacteria bacterium]
LYASRMWHWDDGPTGCISLLYDAERPRYFCPTGSWANSACKINISECDGNLYTSFTRFGAHTSANGDTNADCSFANFANGDVLLTASTDGGKTWGEAVNLTNTNSDGCVAGDCESEHWPSMAKYSTGVVHIRYIEDKDAGGYPLTEGDTTCNPVRYLSHECFTPTTYCQVAYSPTEIGYPTFISPEGQSDCTGEETTSFTLTLTNVGNQTTDYTIVSTETWMTPASGGGTLLAGCGNIQDIEVQIGPIVTEGIYNAELHITTCSAREIDTVSVQIHVFCEFYIPEHEILSTACWSVGVWNTARAGTAQWSDPEGNMYWFLAEPQVSLMYDESIIITYADDTCQTWFSLFDGSHDEVSLVALGPLTTASFGTYEYAHALWANGDTTIIGEIEYYVPVHPDTCVLIERIKVCNDAETVKTIHIGEAIDWDIPGGEDETDTENRCGADESRQMVYQYGLQGTPEENYYGGASFCHDIPGAIVLTNLDWIYDNSGYVPCEIGGLLARHTGFVAETPDSTQDLNSVYVVGQNVVLEPDSCVVYCKVKTSSLTGLAQLQSLIDKGKQWIQ